MELPRELIDQRDDNAAREAEHNRWVYALSCSRMYRKHLMRDDDARLMIDTLACEYARTMSSRELKGLAGYRAATGNRYMTCVYVKAWIKQQRGYAS